MNETLPLINSLFNKSGLLWLQAGNIVKVGEGQVAAHSSEPQHSAHWLSLRDYIVLLTIVQLLPDKACSAVQTVRLRKIVKTRGERQRQK